MFQALIQQDPRPALDETAQFQWRAGAQSRRKVKELFERGVVMGERTMKPFGEKYGKESHGKTVHPGE